MLKNSLKTLFKENKSRKNKQMTGLSLIGGHIIGSSVKITVNIKEESVKCCSSCENKPSS